MYPTTDQYNTLYHLEKWYNKYSHQIIHIGILRGSGIEDVINEFIDRIGFKKYEILYQ